MAVHVARVDLVHLTKDGNPVKKANTTIGDMMTASHEHRVLEDAGIPNSTGFPTVKAYLEAEYDSGFVLRHMDQYYIITDDV